MSWIFLDVAAIETLQREEINRFGGLHGLRDPGLLQSAVLRAEHRAHYDPEATLSKLAASLAWGLIKNHALIDGNKRLGLVSMVVFLRLNGYRFTCSAEEETEMVRRAAASELTEDEWTAWVEHIIAPCSR